MDQSEEPELVQKRRPKWPPRRNIKSGSERGITHPLLPFRSSRISQIYDEPKSQSLLQSEGALKDYLIILGSKKHQVSQNLLDYLEMLKKNEFTEKGGIIEDISSGIAKLKTEGLSETAFQDFKRAAGREVRPETKIFIKTRLFAKIMVISYCDNFNDIGGCFLSLENLSRNKREEIKVTIDSTLRTMVIENMDTNEVKQLTYNIWSVCNSHTKSSQTLCEGEPMKVTIEKSKLPNDETCAAHLQIGTNIKNEPLHLFLWFQNSLFIRKQLNVFSIPLSHFQQTGEDCVKIKLQQRDQKQLVCLYGKHYDNTAAKETSYPEDVISTGELLDSLRNKNFLERRATRSFQSLTRMSDIFLRDVKADIDETDEEGNTLLHHVSCMPLNLRQAENLTWQNRLYARELTTMSPIQLLIHAGANLVAKNASGMTPLIHAMQKGESNQENIKALVCYSKQEDINEVDNEDCTALHHLAKMNTANKVFLTYLTKLLIERGANPTFRDKNGFTSEETAKRCKNTSVENILQNHLVHHHDQQDLQSWSNPENFYQKYRKLFHILGAIFVITAVCLLSVYLWFLGPNKKVCEAPWKGLGNSCFRNLPDSDGDMEFAKKTCAALSARLPTVNSQELVDFLDETMAPGDDFVSFIGAVKVGASWTWMDGTPWGYENWRTSTGEPTGDENCIGQGKEGWNDIPCHEDMYGIVCQKDIYIVNEPSTTSKTLTTTTTTNKASASPPKIPEMFLMVQCCTMPVGWKIAAIADVRKNMQEAQNALGKYHWGIVCLFDGLLYGKLVGYKIDPYEKEGQECDPDHQHQLIIRKDSIGVHENTLPLDSCIEIGIGISNDLAEVAGVESVNECSTHCKRNKDCKFWAWSTYDYYCWLTTSDSGRFDKSGSFSGNSDCP